MKQIIQSLKSGKLALREVPAPKVRAGYLLVETRASLISAGTERMVVDFAKKSLAAKAKARPDLVRKVLDKARKDGFLSTFKAVMARLDEPLPLGYSASGIIVGVGEGLEGAFHMGQRVAVAGAGLANHAELNVVPRNLAAPIPDDVSFEEACFGTCASIALAAVRSAKSQLGDVVAVIGVGLIGQLAVQLLSLQGARVVAVDMAADRLALARAMGAELAWNLAEPGLAEAVAALSGGLGCDQVLIAAATDSSEPLELAAALARDRAQVVMVGKTGTTFDYTAFMKKELTLTVSRSYGPGRYDEDFEGRGMKYPAGWVRWTEAENLRECVRLMSPSRPRRLDVSALTTHRFPLERAEEAYGLVTAGSEPHLGVVLAYEGGTGTRAPMVVPPSAMAVTGTCSLGVIGAGAFARAVLLPELKRLSHVSLTSLCTQRGSSAEHGKQAFGFQRAGTDIQAVLDDPSVNAVLVATRHGSHADLVARALAAGKAVMVEKPLGLDREQLLRVAEARAASPAFFTVGFNRRFAPLSVKLRAHLARHAGPKVLSLRVNAGALPPESWVHAAEEGGRILGEVCHFIDLARYLAGSPITTVSATAAQVTHGACDDLAVQLRFADGSMATIVYTALGDSSASKERFECFAGGTLAVLDNFLSLSITEGGHTRTEKGLGQDKGHRAELEAFAAAVRNGGPAPVDEGELLETSLATILVLDSLREGQPVALE